MPHNPLNPPESPKEIAKQLRWLSEHMIDIGTSMEYYGGFDGLMAAHGKEMVGAGAVAVMWADEIDAWIE